MKNLFSVFFIACSLSLAAQDTLLLPTPVKTGGMPLMQALNARSSERIFNGEELNQQILSNLLWAACGVNRPELGKRTVPFSRNVQDLDVYVITAKGAYKYLPTQHALEKVTDTDIRKYAGMQEFCATAPLNLIYVANSAIGGKADQAFNEKSYAHTGCMVQNVYLFCASEQLNCVVRAMVNKTDLAGVLKLTPAQVITLGQTVGLK